MGNIGPYLFQAMLALFSFFVVAPCILNAVSTFGAQKRFAQEMIEKGVVKAEDVQQMQPKKQIAGIIVSAVVFAALAIACIKVQPAWLSFLCGGLPLILGALRYRRILELNNLTVRRFRNTYKDCMDAKKYNEYVEGHF